MRPAPTWLRVAIAIVALTLGAIIVFRPTTSLGVLALVIGAGAIVHGVLEILGHDQTPTGTVTRRVRVSVGLVWIIVGGFVLVWPGLTVRLLVGVIAGALVLSGGAGIVAAFGRGKTLDARLAHATLGAASIIFGVLTLVWPDISMLVVGVVFGGRLIVLGIAQLVEIIRGRKLVPRPTAFSRFIRTTAAVMALILAAGLGIVSANLRGGSPVVDEFYAAPRTVPDEPGQLIRFEPFERGIPQSAQAWRMLYTTTNGDGSPAIASGLVVVPRQGTQHPTITWAHGTTGVAQQCAPTLLGDPLGSGAMFVLDDIVAQGWAFVATDYIGLGTVGPHPYLVGEPSGRAVLDARRAARQLTDADLGDETVVWGHSQGGGAALWAAALADSYAPDLALSGVAALAPASDLVGLVAGLGSVTGGSVFAAFAFSGFQSTYPDISARRYVRAGAEVTVRQLATRCLAEPGVLASLLTLLGLSQDPVILASDPATGPFGDRLRQNTPPPTMTAPLLIAQGAKDDVIAVTTQRGYVASLTAAGIDVDYREYPAYNHLDLVESDSTLIPELIAWTAQRFTD